MPDHTPRSPEVSPPQAAKPTGIRWLIFNLSCSTSFLLYLHRYTWMYVRPALQDEYGFSNTELGTIESMFFWPYAFGQIPSGVICDMFGAHLFLTGSILLWSVMLAAITVTSSFYLLCGIRVVFGIGQAGTYPSLAKVSRIWFPSRTRTSLQGWIASFGGRTGGALSPILLAGLLMGVCGLSWRVAILIFSAIGIVFGLAFWKFFRSTPADDARVNDAERHLISDGKVAAQAAGRGAMLPMSKVVKNANLLVFIVQQFMNAGADVIFVSLLVSYFKDQLGIDMKASLLAVSLYVSLPLFGGALGGMFGGYLNDWMIQRTGSRRWSRSGIGFSGKCVACIFMFLAVQQTQAAYVAGLLFIVKFFTDWTQPTVWGTCTDIGGRFSGTVVGIINMAGNIGAATMPLVFGIILDRYTVDGATDYTPVMNIGAAMFLISGACWFFIDCTKTLDDDASVTSNAT